jgi:hypothetical protein
MKAAVGAAFGVACAPRAVGARIDVGEGKQGQRSNEEKSSSHESLLKGNSEDYANPIAGTIRQM